MPLVVDIKGIRKAALTRLLDSLLAPVRDVLEAAIVVGSLSYNRDDPIFTTSDLDLMMIVDCGRLGPVMAQVVPPECVSPRLLSAAAGSVARREVDMASIKGQMVDMGFTIHFLDRELFMDLCRWEVREIRAWRIAAKAGQEELRGFCGRRLPYQPRNEPLPVGVRHIVHTSLEVDGYWYIGIPHGRLLHRPHVVHGKGVEFQRAIHELWYAFIDRYGKETPRPFDNTSKSLIDALAKAHHFGPCALTTLSDWTADSA